MIQNLVMDLRMTLVLLPVTKTKWEIRQQFVGMVNGKIDKTTVF